jgi:fluoroquinolone transport system permease protein
MKAWLGFVRWDVTIQARNGFYWASAFVAVAMGALVTALPAAIREQPDVWVAPIVIMNLQITTFFFVTGLVLLDRDEGTLTALAASPLSARQYLAAQAATLTLLATAETIVIIWIGFGVSVSWMLMLPGIALLGVIYTGFGAAIATRYESVNALLLPASVIITLLLFPLLPHFGLASRDLFLLFPTEPILAMIRAAYRPAGAIELAFGIVGSIAWASLAFAVGARCVRALMRDTRATGGR